MTCVPEWIVKPTRLCKLRFTQYKTMWLVRIRLWRLVRVRHNRWGLVLVSEQGSRSSGQGGGAIIELRERETYKKQKHRCQYAFFFFKQQCPLQHKLKNYRKPFWIFPGTRIAAINLFQVDIDKPWNYLWYTIMKRYLHPRSLPFERAGTLAPLSGVPVSEWVPRRLQFLTRSQAFAALVSKWRWLVLPGKIKS